jgi:hypothetical protein
MIFTELSMANCYFDGQPARTQQCCIELKTAGWSFCGPGGPANKFLRTMADVGFNRGVWKTAIHPVRYGRGRKDPHGCFAH